MEDKTKKTVTEYFRNKEFTLKNHSDIASVDSLSKWLDIVKIMGAKEIDITVNIPYGETYAEEITLTPIKLREETDKECQERLIREKQSKINTEALKQRQAEAEMNQLRYLKAKYQNL